MGTHMAEAEVGYGCLGQPYLSIKSTLVLYSYFLPYVQPIKPVIK